MMPRHTDRDPMWTVIGLSVSIVSGLAFWTFVGMSVIGR